MAVRADWHEDAETVTSPEVDPFALPSSTPMMTTLPIDTDSQQLFDRLRTLIRHESGLFNKGVTCAVKDLPETCCSACPLNHSDGQGDSAFLCRVGVEQEHVITLLAAQDAQRGG
jgi:hypothetical protein